MKRGKAVVRKPVLKEGDEVQKDSIGNMKFDGRRFLVIYQVAKSGLWRWKFLVNKQVVVRSDRQWTSPAAAKTAFDGFKKGLSNIVVSGVAYEKKDGTTPDNIRVHRCIKKKVK